MNVRAMGLPVSLDTLLHRLGREVEQPVAVIADPRRRAARAPVQILTGTAAARRAAAAILPRREVEALSRAGLF